MNLGGLKVRYKKAWQAIGSPTDRMVQANQFPACPASVFWMSPAFSL